MAVLSIVLSLLSSYGTLAQQLQECSDPNANPDATPCMHGLCPNGLTCINSPRGEFCCDSTKVYDVTTPRPTTTPAPAPCFDLVHPQTGISSCPSMITFCNNSVYYQLMTQQCPKTCNRCPGQPTLAPPPIPPPPACNDLVNPRTGRSDCPSRAYLCNNDVYKQVMSQQCRKTCRYC